MFTRRCDKCGKWRRVPAGARIDLKHNFHCTMILGLSCKVKEETWQQPAEWDDHEKERDSERRCGKGASDKHERGEKRRNSTTDMHDEDRKKERRVTRYL